VTVSGLSDGKAVAFDAPAAPRAAAAIKHVLALALPILGGQMSTALTGLVDVAMVRSLGAKAVAAVGFGGLVFWVVVALTVGVEGAVQTLSARRKGEGQLRATGPILSEGLRLSLLVALPTGIALAFAAPLIVERLHHDPRVYEPGTNYLVARAFGLFFVMANAAFRGFYNGTSRPRAFLRVALVMLVVQALLNWLLIHGRLGAPRLGVTGAGVAASLSGAVGFALYVRFALGDDVHQTFRTAADAAQRAEIRLSILRLGLPSGLQWALSWAGMLVFLFLAGRVGAIEAGASYLLIQVASLNSLTANSFGFAAASLVSQAQGQKDPDRARRLGGLAGALAAGLLGIVGLAMVAFRGPLLSALSADAQLVARAEPALVACGLFASADAFGIVMTFALIGAGCARFVMAWNLAGMWLVCLPAAWLISARSAGGIVALWLALLGSRSLVGVVMATSFFRRRWAAVRV
jgi:multidrug resistance protein, MATE family